MPITKDKVNLENFLASFTWLNDPNPGQRIELDHALFMQIASLLKIGEGLNNLRLKL